MNRSLRRLKFQKIKFNIPACISMYLVRLVFVYSNTHTHTQGMWYTLFRVSQNCRLQPKEEQIS